MLNGTTSHSKPTVVIVPGSFSIPSFYSTIIDQLASHGYEAVTIDLPSVGRHNGAPAATLADDAAHIQSVTSKLADEGKDIMLVSHSYGGFAASESARGLAKADREAAGKKGSISRLFYMTAFMPEVGASLRSLMGDLLPDYIHVHGDYMVMSDPDACAAITFSDLPPAEGLAWTKQMPEHSTASFAGKLTYPGWKYIPVSFLLCEEDKIIPLDFQKQMVEMVTKETGKDVDVHVLSCGHCPNASVPGKVVEALRKAAGEAIEEVEWKTRPVEASMIIV